MKLIKQTVEGIAIFSRHSPDCPHKKDASYVRCTCVKSMQYQLAGKQIKKTTGERSFARASEVAKAQARILRGEIPETPQETNERNLLTITDAVELWLVHRRVKKKIANNTKAAFVGKCLAEFCRERRVVYLREITTPLTDDFFAAMSDRYANGKSSSLKVHWSMVRAFFHFATRPKHRLLQKIPWMTMNPSPLRRPK